MVGAGDRYLHPFGADRPQTSGPVLQSVAQAPHRLGGRARPRRAACLAHPGRGLTRRHAHPPDRRVRLARPLPGAAAAGGRA